MYFICALGDSPPLQVLDCHMTIRTRRACLWDRLSVSIAGEVANYRVPIFSMFLVKNQQYILAKGENGSLWSIPIQFFEIAPTRATRRFSQHYSQLTGGWSRFK